MPNRKSGVSGPSYAYTPPTHAAGSPPRSTPTVVLAALMNVRLVAFVIGYFSARNTYVNITNGPVYDLPGVACFRNGPANRCE